MKDFDVLQPVSDRTLRLTGRTHAARAGALLCASPRAATQQLATLPPPQTVTCPACNAALEREFQEGQRPLLDRILGEAR